MGCHAWPGWAARESERAIERDIKRESERPWTWNGTPAEASQIIKEDNVQYVFIDSSLMRMIFPADKKTSVCCKM